jgi:hypothetical protein
VSECHIDPPTKQVVLPLPRGGHSDTGSARQSSRDDTEKCQASDDPRTLQGHALRLSDVKELFERMRIYLCTER